MARVRYTVALRRSGAPGRVSVALLAVGLVAEPSPASAQSCHPSALADPERVGATVTLREESAVFRTERYEGHYEGLVLGGGFASSRWSASVAFPAYRLVRNGQRLMGPGDMALGASAEVLRSAPADSHLGLAFMSTLPTGSAKEDLGMGHTMLMPGLFGDVRRGRLRADAGLAYGTAVGASGDHAGHVHGSSPLVDPMNRSEVALSLGASLRASDGFGLHVAMRGAVPVGSEPGAARGILALGVTAAEGPVGTSVGVELPVVGAPFSSKLVLELVVRP